MFTDGNSFIKSRTAKDCFFKIICRFLLFSYIILVLILIGTIIKIGLQGFFIIKIKASNEEEFNIIASVISERRDVLPRIENVKNNISEWLEVKGSFGFYYKSKDTYNEEWNKLIKDLKQKGNIKAFSSFSILYNPDSITQESAGLFGAIKGTLFTTLLFISFAGVVGVATGIYLTEFAKNKFIKNFISLNVSNLASIPPVIYGIFGLNFLVNVLLIPRSSALLGGLILGILTLPIVVIVTSDSLNNVPPHLKFSSKALGLTNLQTVLRVCLPYAFPRILTGLLLTLSRGISEATPLILIGMASFIKAPPDDLLSPATTIATQIYLWVNNQDASFIEKAYSSILILVVMVGIINIIAGLIRYKISRRNIIR